MKSRTSTGIAAVAVAAATLAIALPTPAQTQNGDPSRRQTVPPNTPPGATITGQAQQGQPLSPGSNQGEQFRRAVVPRPG